MPVSLTDKNTFSKLSYVFRTLATSCNLLVMSFVPHSTEYGLFAIPQLGRADRPHLEVFPRNWLRHRQNRSTWAARDHTILSIGRTSYCDNKVNNNILVHKNPQRVTCLPLLFSANQYFISPFIEREIVTKRSHLSWCPLCIERSEQ